jgi:hypothetical protein
MALLLASLVIIAIPFAYYYLLFLPRLKKLEKSNVIFIFERKIYAVPIKVLEETQNYPVNVWQPASRHQEQGRYPTEIQRTGKAWVVKSVCPGLCNGELVFAEMSHRIDGVKIIDEEKSLSLDSKVTRQVSALVKELYCQLEPKLLELNQKISELERVERLARSSEVYAKQAHLYARAASQLRNLIREGQELRDECLRFIRETLIGAEISKFEPDALPDALAWKLQFQVKYRAINEQYQTLRDEVEALSTLRRGTDSVR